jgi:small nuclear ribonucleoprotein (snRNP)-like protein
MRTVLEKNVGKRVVLDTRSSWIYIGTLDQVSDTCLVLKDVDVHDSSDSQTSKDRYLYESRETGIKTNRKKVYVNINYLVSFSLFKDVIRF